MRSSSVASFWLAGSLSRAVHDDPWPAAGYRPQLRGEREPGTAASAQPYRVEMGEQAR